MSSECTKLKKTGKAVGGFPKRFVHQVFCTHAMCRMTALSGYLTAEVFQYCDNTLKILGVKLLNSILFRIRAFHLSALPGRLECCFPSYHISGTFTDSHDNFSHSWELDLKVSQ